MRTIDIHYAYRRAAETCEALLQSNRQGIAESDNPMQDALSTMSVLKRSQDYDNTDLFIEKLVEGYLRAAGAGVEQGEDESERYLILHDWIGGAYLANMYWEAFLQPGNEYDDNRLVQDVYIYAGKSLRSIYGGKITKSMMGSAAGMMMSLALRFMPTGQMAIVAGYYTGCIYNVFRKAIKEEKAEELQA